MKKQMTMEEVSQRFTTLLDIILNSDCEDNVELAQKEWDKLKAEAISRWPEIYGD